MEGGEVAAAAGAGDQQEDLPSRYCALDECCKIGIGVRSPLKRKRDMTIMDFKHNCEHPSSLSQLDPNPLYSSCETSETSFQGSCGQLSAGTNSSFSLSLSSSTSSPVGFCGVP